MYIPGNANPALADAVPSPAQPVLTADSGGGDGLVATGTPDLGNGSGQNNEPKRDSSINPIYVLGGLALLYFIFKRK